MQLHPAIRVPVLRMGDLTILVEICELNVVVVDDDPEIQFSSRIEFPRQLSKPIRVGRIAGRRVDHSGHPVQVAATSGQGPAAAAVRHGTIARRTRREQAQQYLTAKLAVIVGRGYVHDATHAIAVARRETAGVNIDGFDEAWIQSGEYALEIFEVKGFQQLDVVEHHQHLVLQPAPNVGFCRQTDRRHAGQAVGCP